MYAMLIKYMKRCLLLKGNLFLKLWPEWEWGALKVICAMATIPPTDHMSGHMIPSVMDHNVECAESFLKTTGTTELIKKLTVWLSKKDTCWPSIRLISKPIPDWPVVFQLSLGWMAWPSALTQNQLRADSLKYFDHKLVMISFKFHRLIE